jgi:sugar phosphate isomerase/epimerase
VGGSGIKVRPNGLPAGVPVAETIEQIGRSLDEVASYGEGYGIEIRLEIHGRGTSEIPVIKKIMDVSKHDASKLCWNCNAADLNGDGLAANFASVRDRIATVHIHDLISGYPWDELFGLLKGANFDGWTLLEEGQQTSDPIRVMKYYRLLWEKMAT